LENSQGCRHGSSGWALRTSKVLSSNLRTIKTNKQTKAILPVVVAHVSVILATWEAETGRIKVQGQPRQMLARLHPKFHDVPIITAMGEI
jgi:hypothetical protein